MNTKPAARTTRSPRRCSTCWPRWVQVGLFGGEVTAQSVDLRATAAAGSANATGDASGSALAGVTVLGQPLLEVGHRQIERHAVGGRHRPDQLVFHLEVDDVGHLEHARKWPAEHWHLAFQGQLRTVSGADAALLRGRIEAAAGALAGG